MFGDVGHGILMALAALWMVLEEKDPKLRNNTNEVIQRYSSDCLNKKLNLDICNIEHVDTLKGVLGIVDEMKMSVRVCVADLEDDVWGTVSDSADGALFYLHWSHLQRVF